MIRIFTLVITIMKATLLIIGYGLVGSMEAGRLDTTKQVIIICLMMVLLEIVKVVTEKYERRKKIYDGERYSLRKVI